MIMPAKKPPVAKGKAVPPKGKGGLGETKRSARAVPSKGKPAATTKGGTSDKQMAARDKFKEMIAKKKEAAAKKK